MLGEIILSILEYILFELFYRLFKLIGTPFHWIFRLGKFSLNEIYNHKYTGGIGLGISILALYYVVNY